MDQIQWLSTMETQEQNQNFMSNVKAFNIHMAK